MLSVLSILELYPSHLGCMGVSLPSLHYPLTLPHFYPLLTFLACSNRFSSTALHRTSLIARSSKLLAPRVLLDETRKHCPSPLLPLGTSIVLFHYVADGKPLTSLPLRFLQQIPSRLRPETLPPSSSCLPLCFTRSPPQTLSFPEQLGPTLQNRPVPCASLRTTPHSGSEVCHLLAAAPFRTPLTHHQPGSQASTRTAAPPPCPPPSSLPTARH